MQFVICRIIDSKIEFVGADGLTPDPARALLYKDMVAGNEAKAKYFDDYCVFEDQRINYAVIPAANLTTPVVESKRQKFPSPGFFEVHYPRTADDVLNLITDKNFDSLFRATNKIDEAGCWSSGVILNPFSNAVVGHKICFSFDGSIDPEQADTVIKEILHNSDWANVLVHRMGTGAAKWFIVELQAKRK